MKKILYLLVLLPILVNGQSQEKNFVKATTYKVPTTDGITDIYRNPVTDADKMVAVTYFDGLGRPEQQLSIQQSNTGKNIMMHMEYDQFGRQVKEYLPYVGIDGSLVFSYTAKEDMLDYYANPTPTKTGNPDFEATSNPYSEMELELSPLNRIYKKAAPGNDWLLGNGNEMKMDYQTNVNGEVKYYRANAVLNAATGLYNTTLITSNGSGSATYEEGQLFKMVTKDENWKPADGNNNTTEEFKDKMGQVVLKKTYNNGIAYETYYVYDQFGNLTYVIPPAVVNFGLQVNILCYQYKYDYRNRVGAKRLPGKQWEYIVYNNLDQPVATGPVFTPWGGITQGWMMTKYDAFGRVLYTGYYSGVEPTTEAGRKTYADKYLTGEQYEGRDIGKVLDGVAVWHGNKIYPMSNFKMLTVNYYDDYNFPRLTVPTGLIENQKPALSVKGMATGSWVRFLDNANNTVGESSYVVYDDLKYVPISNYMVNHLGGFTQIDNKIDFTTKSLYTITTHKRETSSALLTLRDDYTYSDQERMLTHYHTINSGTPELISQNSYDELGQLIVKNVGRTIASPFQKVDYRYNVRGWLKSINDTANLVEGGAAPPDLFAFKMSYNDPQVGGGKALYNGNISETFWRSKSDNVLRKYKYSYDNLNRLLEANYSKPGVSITDSYLEKLTYDKNGNILTLIRNGNLDSNNTTVNNIDNLTYYYTGNQLQKVVDGSNSPQGFKDDSIFGIDLLNDYSYDSNGNMKNDENKGITDIVYNQLNLPTFINFGLNKIEYLYNSVGIKLQKKVTEFGVTGNVITITDYLGGFQYKNSTLLFFPHAEGYVNNTVVNGVNNYNYVYNYTDHLGNIRMSYAFDTPTSSLKILEENHYYPFGLKQTNYNSDRRFFEVLTSELRIFAVAPSVRMPYQYKFNNREWQDELGLNVTAMDYRQYDNALGRFNSIDALSERAYDISPYRFALNNPNLWMDPTGLFETRKEAREYRREHGIRGGISRDSDGSFSINDKKNGVSYFKPEAGSNFVVDSEGVTQGALVSVEKKESNVVSTGKTINDYAGLGLAPVEFIPGSFRLGTANQAFSPKYYSNWTTGNQYTKVTTLSKLGKGLGYAGAGIGLILDAKGVKNYYDPKYGPNSPNSVHPGKAGLNTGMAAYGLWVNPIASIFYSGIDTFYPGGWVGASETATRTENQEQKMTGHPFFSNSALKF